MASVKLENGKRHRMKPNDEITCHTHGIVTTWGALDPIQQLAFLEGLDVVEDAPCLLRPSAAGKEEV